MKSSPNLFKAITVLFNKVNFHHQEDFESLFDTFKSSVNQTVIKNTSTFTLHPKNKHIEKKLNSFISNEINLNYFEDLIVFGSAADGTFLNNWSDYDILVILKNEHISKQRTEINKINNWLGSHNHHGVNPILIEMLSQWCQNWMPLQIFQNGYSYNNANYKCKYYNKPNDYKHVLDYWNTYLTNASLSGLFDHHPLDGKYLTNNPKEINDRPYQLKYFLSVIFLLPCFLYNYYGYFHTKDICLHHISKSAILSDRSKTFLNYCSRLRQTWKENNGALMMGIDSDFTRKIFLSGKNYCDEINAYIKANPQL